MQGHIQDATYTPSGTRPTQPGIQLTVILGSHVAGPGGDEAEWADGAATWTDAGVTSQMITRQHGEQVHEPGAARGLAKGAGPGEGQKGEGKKGGKKGGGEKGKGKW